MLERYENEVKRVLSVIELQLTRTGNEYLVGGKVCYADLMFVSWNMIASRVMEGFDWKAEYPKSFAWNEKLISRPSVKKVMADNEKAKAEGH